jgi:hypothetical protein
MFGGLVGGGVDDGAQFLAGYHPEQSEDCPVGRPDRHDQQQLDDAELAEPTVRAEDYGGGDDSHGVEQEVRGCGGAQEHERQGYGPNPPEGENGTNTPTQLAITGTHRLSSRCNGEVHGVTGV